MSHPRRLSVAAALSASLLAVVASVGSPSSAATTAPSLAVDGARNVHVIPDTIYGINWASSRLRAALRVPVNRWGGNETSLYDYTSNAYNNGNDWYFENQIGTDTNHRLGPWVTSNRSTNTPSLVAVPMLGWVADGTKPNACGFSITKYGTQDAHDPGRPDCGNGQHNGQPVTGNNPLDFAKQVTITAQAGGMVTQLVTQQGSASAGGVGFYELDNEPGLWHSTHRSVHPAPLTHDEWWEKARPTAEAVKAADPGAKILAPSDAGYCWWLYDAADGCGPGPNHAITGDVAPWYVKQFKDYADAHSGKRLLDYLDEHYYPASPNGSPQIALAPTGTAATQARRLRSTRSLWDPTYRDESWIGGVNDVNAPPLQFIRKLRSWAAVYPGTKTAITEYNWGGFDSINGALAQADVLGIFGRERLDLATLWNYDNALDGTSVEWAFRIYRNYDGRGARFSSGGCHAASTDQGRLSIYASRNSAAMTVVVINKTGGALTSALNLKNYAHQHAGRTYTLASTNPKAITQKAISIGGTGFTYSYPAKSVTLIRILHT